MTNTLSAHPVTDDPINVQADALRADPVQADHSHADPSAVDPAAGDPSAVDPAVVEAFTGRLLTDFAAAAGTAMTVVGDRLGLYRAMTGAGPLTAEEVTDRSGLNLRLVTEWLASQTVSGYVRYEAASGRYELPAEHAMALSVIESPAYIVGAAEVVAGQYATLPQLERAFRGDGGVDYRHFPATTTHGIERFFRTAYTHQLEQVWLPAIDGLLEKLEGGARVADVGCGHGAATLLMARRFPQSRFVGFDLDEPSIAVARSRSVQSGVQANVEFRVSDAGQFGPGPFDVVFFFDALHDLGDPAAALRRAQDLLTPGGMIVAVEPWSTGRLEDGIGNPLMRMNYAISTSLCTPTSLAQHGVSAQPGFGLGTCGGPARRLELLAGAGFIDGRVAVDTGQNLVLSARTAG